MTGDRPTRQRIVSCQHTVTVFADTHASFLEQASFRSFFDRKLIAVSMVFRLPSMKVTILRNNLIL